MSDRDLTNIIDSLENDKEYLLLPDEDQQAIIRHVVSGLSEKNPENSDNFKSVASERRIDYLRRTGQGRYIPDHSVAMGALSSEVGGLKFDESGNLDFSQYSDDEALSVIQQARDSAQKAGESIDYLNSTDSTFYINQFLDNQERHIHGKNTGYVADKAYRATDAFIGTFVSPFSQEFSDELTGGGFTPENPVYDEDFGAALASGFGDLAGQTSLFLLTSGAGSAAGAAATTARGVATGAMFGANASRKFQDNYLKAVDLGESEADAFSAGIASLPGAVIDSMGDRLIAGKFLPKYIGDKMRNQLKNSVTQAQKAKALERPLVELAGKPKAFGRFKDALRDGIAEGVSEAAGDAASSYGGYLTTDRKEFIPTSKELFTSFAVGGILGGVGSATGSILGTSDRAQADILYNEASDINDKYNSEIQKVIEGGGSNKEARAAALFEKRDAEINALIDNVQKISEKSEPEDATPQSEEEASPSEVTDNSVDDVESEPKTGFFRFDDELAKLNATPEEVSAQSKKLVDLSSFLESKGASIDNYQYTRNENGDLELSARPPDNSVNVPPKPRSIDPDKVERLAPTLSPEEVIQVKVALENLSAPTGQVDKRVLKRNQKSLDEISAKSPNEVDQITKDFNNRKTAPPLRVDKPRLSDVKREEAPTGVPKRSVTELMTANFRLEENPEAMSNEEIQDLILSLEESAEEKSDDEIDSDRDNFTSSQRDFSGMTVEFITSPKTEVPNTKWTPSLSLSLDFAWNVLSNPDKHGSLVNGIARKTLSELQRRDPKSFAEGMIRIENKRKGIGPQLSTTENSVTEKADLKEVQDAFSTILTNAGKESDRRSLLDNEKIRIVDMPDSPFRGAFVSGEGGYIAINIAHVNKGDALTVLEHEIGHAAYLDPEIRSEIDKLTDLLDEDTKSKIEDLVSGDEDYAGRTSEEASVRRFQEARSLIRNGVRNDPATKGILNKIKDLINKFFKNVFGLDILTVDRVTDRVMAIGLSNWVNDKTDPNNTVADAVFPRTAQFDKATDNSVNPNQKDIDNAIKAFNESVRTKEVRLKSENRKTSKNTLAEIDGYEESRSSMRFVNRTHKKNDYDSSDHELTTAIKSVDRILPAIANLPMANKIPRIIQSINNFNRSRNKRKIKGTEERLGNDSEIAFLNSIKAEYSEQQAARLIEQYNKIFSNQYGPNGDSGITGDGTLEDVNAWIALNSELINANKGSGKEASEAMIAQVQEVIDNAHNATPEDFLQNWEGHNGEVHKEAREDVLADISAVYEYLDSFNTGGDPVTEFEAKEAFIIADARNNGQMANIRNITTASQKKTLTDKAKLFSDKWKPLFTWRFLKSLVALEPFQVTAKRISYTKEGQDFFTEDVFGGLTSGFLKAKNQSYLMDKRVAELWDSHIKRLKIKPKDQNLENIYLTTASILTQIKTSSEYSSESSFKENVANLNRSIKNMRENPDKSISVKTAGIAQEVLDRLMQGIDIESGKSYSDFIGNIASRLSYDGDISRGEARVELLNNFNDVFVDTRAHSKFITEAYRDQAFQGIDNYIPTHTIDPYSSHGNTDIEKPISDRMGQTYNATASKVSETKSRQKSIGNSYYDYNILGVITRQINATNIENYTAKERFILSDLLKIPKGDNVNEFIDALGGSGRESANVFKSRISLMIDNELRRTEAMPDPLRLMKGLQGRIARAHLSGLSQFVAQPAAAMTHWSVTNMTTGKYQSMIDAMAIMGTKGGRAQVNEFFEKHNSVLHERTLGANIDIDKKSVAEIKNVFTHALGKFDKATEKILLAPLRNGDGMSTKLIFLAEYLHLSKENSQVGQDMRKLDLDRPNFKLIDQANRIADQFIGPSSRGARGSFFSDRSSPMAFVRMSTMAYAHHLTALGSQLQQNISKIYNMRRAGDMDGAMEVVRDTAGIMGQVAAFSATKFIVNAGLATMLISLIKSLYDDDEGKIAEIEKKIDESKTKEEKLLWEQELRYAESVRSFIVKEKSKKLSGESIFKSMIRDTVTGSHVILNAGNSFLPKLLFGTIDDVSRRDFDKLIDDQSSQLSDQIKEQKSYGNMDEARRLEEIQTVLNDSEYIPIVYDFPSDSAFGGILGASIDSVADPIKNLSGAYIPQLFGKEPVTSFGLFDAWAGLIPMGASQTDISKAMKAFAKLEREKWKIEEKGFEKEEKLKKERLEEQNTSKELLDVFRAFSQ